MALSPIDLKAFSFADLKKLYFGFSLALELTKKPEEKADFQRTLNAIESLLEDMQNV